MIGLDIAREILLEYYNPILRRSLPFGDVVFPGCDRSNLMHVTDLVWIKYILDDLDLTEAERNSWAARINRDQEAETGLFRYPPDERHIDAHATWQCVAALNMLGRQPLHQLRCIKPLLTVNGFRNWCDEYDPATSHHRFMLAVIAAASKPPNEEWRAVFGEWYDDHQNPETGFPCDADSSGHLSPAFLLTTMRFAFCGSVPRADRIVRTVLGFQSDRGGFTESDVPGYMDMDASFLLHLLSASAEVYKNNIEHALRRVGEFVDQVLTDGKRCSQLLGNPHRALAVCGNLSVLWRHLGLCGGRHVPFPWAELEHYRVSI